MILIDKNKKEHSLAITIGSALLIKNKFSVNLLDTQQTLSAMQMDDQDAPEKTMLMLDICYTLAESNNPGLSKIDFFNGIDGDTLGEASKVFLCALENFTPSRPMKVLIRRGLAMIETVENQLTEAMENLDFLENAPTPGK